MTILKSNEHILKPYKSNDPTLPMYANGILKNSHKTLLELNHVYHKNISKHLFRPFVSERATFFRREDRMDDFIEFR